MLFRDLLIVYRGDTLAKRYEDTMLTLDRIAQAGYQVKVQWESEFEIPENRKVVEIPLEKQRRPAWREYRSHASTLQSKAG